MTGNNSHSEMIGANLSQGESAIEHNFDLPGDYRELTAMKVAIETKMAHMQTAGAEALRKKIAEESAALGMTPEEIVTGSAGRNSRGRKAKSKRDE